MLIYKDASGVKLGRKANLFRIVNRDKTSFYTILLSATGKLPRIPRCIFSRSHYDIYLVLSDTVQ